MLTQLSLIMLITHAVIKQVILGDKASLAVAEAVGQVSVPGKKADDRI